MTAIAWDGQFLCGDSLAVGGHIVQRDMQKIFTFDEGPYVAIGVSGALGNVEAVIDWVRGGERPACGEGLHVEAIAINADGEAFNYSSEILGFTRAGRIEAGGSGGCHAIGAMLAGASAFKAVEIAIQLDPHCGGPVQCYDVANRVLTGPFGLSKKTQILPGYRAGA